MAQTFRSDTAARVFYRRLSPVLMVCGLLPSSQVFLEAPRPALAPVVSPSQLTRALRVL